MDGGGKKRFINCCFGKFYYSCIKEEIIENIGWRYIYIGKFNIINCLIFEKVLIE